MDVNLEHQEIEAIAALKENFGYKMLLDKIQAEVDNVQAEILDSYSPVNPEKVLFWRSLYKILVILKVCPEDMCKEMYKLKESITYNDLSNQLDKVPQDYIDSLLKLYEERKKKANKI